MSRRVCLHACSHVCVCCTGSLASYRPVSYLLMLFRFGTFLVFFVVRVCGCVCGVGVRTPRTALFYCCFSNLLGMFREDHPTNATISGALAGCLYKSLASWKVKAAYTLTSARKPNPLHTHMHALPRSVNIDLSIGT